MDHPILYFGQFLSGRKRDHFLKNSFELPPIQLETVVGFFRSLRELAPPDVDLSELGALLDPLPEVIPGSTGI